MSIRQSWDMHEPHHHHFNWQGLSFMTDTWFLCFAYINHADIILYYFPHISILSSSKYFYCLAVFMPKKLRRQHQEIDLSTHELWEPSFYLFAASLIARRISWRICTSVLWQVVRNACILLSHKKQKRNVIHYHAVHEAVAWMLKDSKRGTWTHLCLICSTERYFTPLLLLHKPMFQFILQTYWIDMTYAQNRILPLSSPLLSQIWVSQTACVCP